MAAGAPHASAAHVAGAAAAQRVERGDWQTPVALAREALRVAWRDRDPPATVLEPTCGEGAFLAAAAELFPRARLLGFDIDPGYVQRARSRLPTVRASVHHADFFTVDWDEVLREQRGPLLIAGNLPWVTNAALGALHATNLPEKSNFKQLKGLDARTGKSNFDISEWMLLRLLEAVMGRGFTLAMLCKASVARKVMESAARAGWSLRGEVRSIDARLHFGAAVDAVLMRLESGRGEKATAGGSAWPVYSSLTERHPTRTMGVHDGRACSDIEAFRATASLEGLSEFEWRSGVKHDLAKAMELRRIDGALTNGFGSRVEVESDYVFPLLKGSDVAKGRSEPRRWVLVPQRRLGEDTELLRERAPRLWSYLCSLQRHFDARKSSIYRNQPPFSIFGIGDYTFAPYKVAICGLYKKLAFHVLRPHAGRPVLVDDTVYSLSFESEDEAERVREALSSDRAQAFFEARVFWDAKRPISKALLQTLSLEKLLDALGTKPAGSVAPADSQYFHFEHHSERAWPGNDTESSTSGRTACCCSSPRRRRIGTSSRWTTRWS